jgi:hypothetical protein
MDMNFPHKNPQWIARDAGADVPAQFAKRQALLTRAIARQASSQSAQDFVAASQGLQDSKKAVRPSFMDERMAFFAGRPRPDLAGHREPILFRTGCFRPDLAQRENNKMHR